MRLVRETGRPIAHVAVAALIATQRDEHKIPHAIACRALGVSRSWFYKGNGGQLTPRAARREALAAGIRLFAAHRGTYGAQRTCADLRELGWVASRDCSSGRAGSGPATE